MKIIYDGNTYQLDNQLITLLQSDDILSILPSAERAKFKLLVAEGGVGTFYFPTVDVWLRMCAVLSEGVVIVEIYCIDVTDLASEIAELKKHIELSEEKISTLEKVVLDNTDKIRSIDKWMSLAKNSIGIVLVSIKIAPFVITAIYALFKYLGW